MKLFHRIFPTAVLVALTLSACSKKAAEEIDFGTISNSQYQNKYLGFTIKLPEGWSVQDREANNSLMQTGSSIVAGDNENLKSVIKAAELQSVVLFMVSEHPAGSPVVFNPNIVCIAEKTRHMPGIKTGKDYHFHARKFMENSALKMSFSDEITTETLDGIGFDVMKSELSLGIASVQQLYYASIQNGYALTFILSFTTPQESASLQKILATFKSTK